MNTMHPDETTIQLYASHPENCPVGILNHIAGCQHCLAQAALYKQVFTALQEAPAPAFEFNLSQLVLQQLPKSKPAWSPAFIITGFLLAAIIAIAGWYFQQEILQLFKGIVPVAIYLSVIVTAAIALFQGIEMYRRYEKLISNIN
jgi:hypothetical protein